MKYVYTCTIIKFDLPKWGGKLVIQFPSKSKVFKHLHIDIHMYIHAHVHIHVHTRTCTTYNII